MKKSIHFLPLLAGLFVSCNSTDTVVVEDTDIKTIVISATDFENAHSNTRTEISSDLHFSWSTSDLIGIYAMDGSPLYFPMSNGAGTNTAVFDGGGWALKNTSCYCAYYPFDVDNTFVDYSEIPFSYEGQSMSANGSRQHLGAYDYMTASFVVPQDGVVNFDFKHLNSLFKISAKSPVDETYSKLSFVSEDNVFVKKLTMDISRRRTVDQEFTNTMDLLLNDIHVSEGETIDAWMMFAPTDLSGKKISLVLESNSGSVIEAEFDGIEFEAGKAYSIDTELKTIEESDIPYITFSCENTQTVSFKITSSTSSTALKGLQYSVNNSEWVDIGTYTITFGGTNGDIRFRCDNGIGSNGAIVKFGNANEVSCKGDIRTLVDYKNYKTVDCRKAKFNSMFRDCSQLLSAPDLPIRILGPQAYYWMFYKCTNLKKAPDLPATILSNNSYSGMFEGCASLEDVPRVLPAKRIAYCSYERMFSGCTSLKVAPEIEATEIEERGCYNMFSGCTSLEHAPSILYPENLADQCYYYMFSKCTALTKAPKLPAKVLASGCYSNMFNGCAKLREVTMLATNIKADNCLNIWLSGVYPSGTFYKNYDATWDATGTSGIPTGWVVKYIKE